MTDLQKAPWPEWETVRLIGRGSYGAVYEIQRELLGEVERAAMKVITIPQNSGDIDELRTEGYSEESISKLFTEHLSTIKNEYDIMRKLKNCVNVVDCDDVHFKTHEDGIGEDVFIRMELLTPLTKALPDEIPEELVIRLGRDITNALVQCKKHDIVHRDIKPQNIFVSHDGDYKLGDFGVAKRIERTMGGTKIGTYKYMAPEVYNNQDYGSLTDIYSLGLVLYWMLNERRLPFLPLPPAPLKADADEKARSRRFSGESIPAPAHGSAELKRIVLKACAYRPGDRYASAAEMLRDLNALGSVSATPISERTEYEPTESVFSWCEPMPAAGQEKKLQNAPADGATEGLGYKRPQSADPAPRPVPVRTVPVQHVPTPITPAPTDTKQLDKKHSGLAIAAIIAGILFAAAVTGAVVLIWLNPCIFGHDWRGATCTEPEICRVCGLEGDPSEGHSWSKATCTEPQRCRECGKKGKDALGHSWSDANCTEPQFCLNCGETGGPALGHNWIAATYATPQICARCGILEGTALYREPKSLESFGISYSYGKLWVRSNSSASGSVHTPSDAPDCWSDWTKHGYSKGATSDNQGNRYSFGIHIDGDKSESYYYEIELGGKYTMFSGVCGCPAEGHCISGDRVYGTSYTKYFEVYGDGKLLYTSPTMRYDSAPLSFIIDVTGVRVLRIQYPASKGPNEIATLYDGVFY